MAKTQFLCDHSFCFFVEMMKGEVFKKKYTGWYVFPRRERSLGEQIKVKILILSNIILHKLNWHGYMSIKRINFKYLKYVSIALRTLKPWTGKTKFKQSHVYCMFSSIFITRFSIKLIIEIGLYTTQMLFCVYWTFQIFESKI